MRSLIVACILLLSGVATAQQVVPIKGGVGITGSGSSAASGLFYGTVCENYTVGTVTGGGSIVFQIATVDPQNPSGGTIASASSASISSAYGPAATCITSATSSSVVVSWTVTGTFSATVWLSVQGLIGQGGSGGGGGGAQPDAGLLVQFNGDGGVGAVAVMNNVATTTAGDGGTQPVVVVGQSAPVQVQLAGDGGVLSTNIVGGSVTVTGGGAQDAGVYLLNSYTAPAQVDNSEQTACQGGVVLCASGPATAITVQSLAKSQTIQNNSSANVCFGFTAGLSCSPAFDAGTTVGFPLVPGQAFTETGSVQMYCVTAGSPMVAPDAGLNYADCR
jgi:hypothetical protein